MKKIIITFLSLILLTGCSFFQNDDSNLQPANEQKTIELYQETNYSYYYQSLDDDEKELYTEIYNCLTNYDNKTEINTADYDTVSKINDYVLYDHPEIFYLNYYEIQNQVSHYYYLPKYSYTENEVTDLTNQLETVRNDFINSLDSSLSDYDNLKAVYNFVIEKSTYVEGAKDNQQVTSALIYGNTVCSGYVKAIQYLCYGLNINTAYIVGKPLVQTTENTEYHAWNLVVLEDDYYYIDATWGDYVDDNNSFTMYSYFMFDSNDMLKLYQPTDKYETTKTNTYCYFNHDGYYNNTYDLSNLSSMVRKYQNTNIQWMEFKFSDDCYQKAKSSLIDQQEMFDLFDNFASGQYQINYIYLDNLNVLIFKLA